MSITNFQTMLKAQRHSYIMEKLRTDEKVLTSSLALDLNLSEDTVRRDLSELDRKKFLKKVYGGAILFEEKINETFNIHITSEEKKERIVKKALSLLVDGQVIIMSGGKIGRASCRERV